MTLELLRQIFQKQSELATRYHEVELLNGYEPLHYPLDIQSRAGQDRCRAFFAYTVEEVAEAATATPEDYPEELSDILHFVVELAIMVGSRPEEVYAHALLEAQDPVPETPDFASFIVSLGMAMNTLKMKPWKQTPKPTDPQITRFHVSMAVHQLIGIFQQDRLDAHALYFAKHNINQSRIENAY